MHGTDPGGHGREHPDGDAAGPWLATDRHRFNAREHTPDSVTRTLTPDTVRRLAEGSTAADVPGPVTLLTAWTAVLHRHTQQRDLLIGLDPASFTDAAAPAGNTPDAATVPLRVRLRPDAAFADERARIHTAVTEALARDPGGTPATDPRAVAGRAPAPSLRHGTWDVALTLDSGPVHTHLTLHYNASLFTRATAQWILGHCATLLTAAVATPGTPVRELPVQDEPAPAPWRLPVPDGYRPPEPARRGEGLVDRFRRTAAAHPARLAVTGPQGSLTYAELDRVSDTVARRLRRTAGPGDRVALLYGHDVGAVAAIWAVLKTGAAYVPLDPRQPDGRLTRLLTDADCTTLVCDPALADRAGSLARGARTVPADPFDIAVTSPAPPEAPTPGDPDAPAYLLHTSGSTGRPKAVVQSHANVLAHTLAYADRLRIGPRDHIPLLARYTFDAAVMDLYAALLTGATLHVEDPVATAPELRERLRRAATTVLHTTPTLFRHLVGDLPEEGGPDPAFASVRAVVLGGEEAGQHDLRRFLAAFGRNAALVNGLGPTECTLIAQYLAGATDLGGTALPVGHPVEGISLRLLDEEGRGTELLGELEVRGERVAHGYWNEPDATAAAFGTGADGTRHYRTGDLARRRADGALVFAGRKDRQIKLRGHRIEPGEIEAALRSHPTVAEAVVAVDTRAPAPRLVGYVTPATGFPPDTGELLAYLARTLPDHAVPWRIVALDRLPLGPTGKVDRARLPAPGELPSDAAAAPTTPLERTVAQLWCRVLGTDSADLHGNFMAAGGDSVRLLTLLGDVRRELDAEVPLLEFLAAPTIDTLVKLIERET
ncbi:amino acid adenylation domain-containing protein [Streptomyces luomodiensis]|uniref:Amino acid adenylation domain-containing protein n=1 Tax=Streptomyces luomodiensis TaxID=3026192 RepID=A0ABY9V8R5_9ACTN|nr:amino acid adenylation domain-containing protein [Streptomyces sp. SCA4-21]WNF01042.1 amino acid adenylation domain-containing protein [Streptomyces sp. SCA4-21]